MRTRDGSGEFATRGATAWNDGLYPIDGGGNGNRPNSIAKAESSGNGTAGSVGNGTSDVAEKTWFTPVDSGVDENGCKDGVCPVPWVVKEEPPVIVPDTVNHPSHYIESGGIECIEAIEAQLTNEEYKGYLRGNCVKYLWRWTNKGGLTDLKKCQWYLDRLIQFEEINTK